MKWETKKSWSTQKGQEWPILIFLTNRYHFMTQAKIPRSKTYYLCDLLLMLPDQTIFVGKSVKATQLSNIFKNWVLGHATRKLIYISVPSEFFR